MSTKCLTQDAGRRTQDAGCRMQDALNCRVADEAPPSGKPGSGSLLPSSGSRVSSLMGTTIPEVWDSAYRCLLCSQPFRWQYVGIRR